jgi:L,D-transpeptidase YbiS
MTISYHQLSGSSRPPRPNRFLYPQALATRRWRGRHLLAGVAGLSLLAGLFFLIRPGDSSEVRVPESTVAAPPQAAPADKPRQQAVASAPVAPDIAKLRAKNAALSARISALAPASDYLVIDTAGNKVLLRRGESTKAEMVASCGSGNVLEDPASGRRWVFDTPRGQFRIQSKLTNPVWMKPDWAFIEEGEAIPKKLSARAEPGMMGDYALGIGQGYFIHGTLYTRMLGRNVSHGCVRLGDKDLAQLYRTLPIGARVIIF